MTEGDSAAIQVRLGQIKAELLLHGQPLRREGLIHLDGVHLVQGEAGFGQ